MPNPKAKIFKQQDFPEVLLFFLCLPIYLKRYLSYNTIYVTTLFRNTKKR